MKRGRQLILGLSLAAILSPSTALFAATSGTNSTQALEISPPVIPLTANPGQTLTTNIRIRDVANNDLIVRGKADDFGAGDENGDPKILLDETSATRYSLKYWIASVPDLHLVSREIKTLTVTINVPQNAEPGGHYGVVRFTGTPPGLDGQGVALSASIGALILLRVNGPVTEKASVVEFYATTANGTRKALYENGPLALVERIKNQGTVHVAPTGSIDIRDIFGHLVDVVPANEPPRNILPDSIRKFSQPWNKKWLFGRYTASVNLLYGNSKQSLLATTSFWVIPYRLILLVALILAALFFILRVVIRNYNRRIIAKASRARRKR